MKFHLQNIKFMQNTVWAELHVDVDVPTGLAKERMAAWDGRHDGRETSQPPRLVDLKHGWQEDKPDPYLVPSAARFYFLSCQWAARQTKILHFRGNTNN